VATGYVDVEALVIDWLKTRLEYRYVSDELPPNLVDLLRTDPVHVVERFGGSDQTLGLDVARVDIDTFANSRAGAKLHAETVRSGLRLYLTKHVYAGTVVSKVETISAPIHAPYDSRRAVRRFTQAVQITAHQFSGVT
jgi:hypothetical protein